MVAWEQQLEARAFHEWRDKYVSYAKLKRSLERIEKVFKQRVGKDIPEKSLSEKDVFRRMASNLLPFEEVPENRMEAAGSNDSLLGETRQMQDQFMDDVLKELKKCSDWYSGTCAALESRTKTIAHEGEDDVAGAAGLRSFAGRDVSQNEEVEQLHMQAVRLTDYVMLNSEALRKIVKKLDKQCGTEFQDDFVKNHMKNSHLATFKGNEAVYDGERARACRRKLEDLLSPERLQELRNAAITSYEGAGLTKMTLRPRRVLSSALLGILAFLAAPRFFPGEENAQRCFVLVLFIVSLWVSEAAPFEATAMLVPPLAVFMEVLKGEREECAKKLLAAVFNDSLYLVLCGFVISSVFSHCHLDSRAASSLQRLFGGSPFVFMLAVMFLGTFLSALLSNVTAPLLLVEVLKPLLRDMPTDSRYSRAMLLGLAFACNIGGMMTPISSPQNVAALQTLRSQGRDISWSQWLMVSLPFCSLSVVIAWLLLMGVYLVDRSPVEKQRDELLTDRERKKAWKIPLVMDDSEPFTASKVISLLGASATLLAFAFAPIAAVFGGTASTALFFVAVALGTGTISRSMFNNYSWHLLFLIGGGNALGLAVRESGLLAILTELARERLASSPWLLVSQLVLILIAATTFVSHTVAALVLMPLVVDLGVAAGVPERAVLVGALACSAACALPMTSFPNVNSLMATDDSGTPWLGVKHFLQAGIPMTALVGFMLCTVGYWLAVWACP